MATISVCDSVRITEPANRWNHPDGMWWDAFAGKPDTFRVVEVYGERPTQYVVDVSHVPALAHYPRGIAYVPAGYVELVTVASAGDGEN
jgi:hypothetical protein